jgi:dTDP-4-dehydrorhamnose 3,5-epimerase
LFYTLARLPFEFKKLEIPEILLITPRVWSDGRGSFSETYKRSDFAAAGAGDVFVQENHSTSVRGVLRGLHFQRPPRAQNKLVRVLSGEIFDVAVDLRPDSATRGQWVGVVLSAEAGTLIYVPGWCAHGFCVLSERADVLYHTSEEYSPEHEAGIMWNDPALGITWPIADPIVSERDKQWPVFS